jgi:hypothetical protein
LQSTKFSELNLRIFFRWLSLMIGWGVEIVFNPNALLSAPLPAWQINAEDLAVVEQTQATNASRQQQYQEQRQLIRPERYDRQRYPVTDALEAHWRKTLWATALLEPKEFYVAEGVATLLDLALRPDLSSSQQKTVQMALQIGTQLYLSDLQFYSTIGNRLQQILERSPDPEWAGMALSALVQGEMKPESARFWSQQLRSRFSDHSSPVLEIALRDVEEQLSPSSFPPLADLLNWSINPQQAHLYVFCRPNRQILCRAVLKDRNGQFIRQNESQTAPLWSVLLLSRSLHNLRWNFVRGHTPQGIYRIEGTMPRSQETYFRAYGQFPLIKVFLPFESGVKAFVPSMPEQLPTTLPAYRPLLPPSWRDYFPMQQSYWAGKLGRSLIRLHGSGEAPTLFANSRRYPDSFGWNPSIGCIAAIESYDASGRLIQADMPNILKAVSTAAGGAIEGYLVVVEVPNHSGQVLSLSEIEEVLERSPPKP